MSGPSPWPGVVVVHDALGLSDDIRAITDRFATAGYLALAPDLFSRGGMVRCVKSVFSQLYSGSGRAFDDLDAARTLLSDRDDSSGKVGVAGFCMGGGFALVAAARGFDASAPYYGDLPKDTALAGACPVVASFGPRTGSCACARPAWRVCSPSGTSRTTWRSTRTPGTASPTESPSAH